MANFEQNIPDRCRNCQMVQNTLAHIEQHEEAKEVLTEHAMSDTPELLSERILDTLIDHDIDIDPDDADLGAKMRQGIGQALDELDEHMEEIERFGNELVLGCRGLLKLRASSDNVTYTVAVCRSPHAPMGENIEPTIVKRASS